MKKVLSIVLVALLLVTLAACVTRREHTDIENGPARGDIVVPTPTPTVAPTEVPTPAPTAPPALTAAPLYRKERVPVGYVKVSEVCAAGTELLVRTLEGDLEVTADDTLCIMIGVSGEVYPIREDVLRDKYALTEEPYDLFRGDYPPTVRDVAQGKIQDILPCAKRCSANENDATLVHSLQLERRTKVFTAWSEDNYMLGLPGDLLVASVARPGDKYIVNGEIFERTYRRATEA